MVGAETFVRRGATRRRAIVSGGELERYLMYRGSDDDLPAIPALWCFKKPTGAKGRYGEH